MALNSHQNSLKYGAILIAACLSACSRPQTLETADDLASALKDAGLQYDTTEGIDTSNMRYAKIDQAIALTGDNLNVEILLIEDRHTYDLAKKAQEQISLNGALHDSSVIDDPTIYARRPYFIVIRQEPQAGDVLEVLQKILPEDLG